MRESHLESGGRYPVLRTIAILFMVGAVIVGIYGVYQAIVTLVGVQRLEAVDVAPNWLQQTLGFFVWLAVTFFAVIVNLAVAEGIKLFIDIEHSCRTMAVGAFSTSAANLSEPVSSGPDGGVGGRFSDETAESALLKGHY